jgi:hypothetical protein
MAILIAVLIGLVVVLQVVQIRHVRAAQSWPLPSPPRADHVPLIDTITLRLTDAKGVDEFEVGWHRGELPTSYRHAGEVYIKGGTRADGSVEYRRQ